MYLIGIVSNKKDLKFEKVMKDINNEIVIERINTNNIENKCQKKFDIIILEKNFKDIGKIINKTSYIIMNENTNYNFKTEDATNIITFGFRNKSTATISSVEDKKILMSLQRGFKNIYNQEILPQEIKINTQEKLNINKHMEIKLVEIILKESH